MDATFLELPLFERYRDDYLDDAGYMALQAELMARPDAGSVMPGCGGLRKLRWADSRRSKGRRGGLRVIYFHREQVRQIWLFTLYDKNEMDDLSLADRREMAKLLVRELGWRTLRVPGDLR